MTPEQRMMYEMLGEEEAYMKNVMRQYNSNGDFTAGGLVVSGMCVNGIPESERHQIIDISESTRQKMFDETKKTAFFTKMGRKAHSFKGGI